MLVDATAPSATRNPAVILDHVTSPALWPPALLSIRTRPCQEMGSIPSPSLPSSIDVSILYVHPDGVTIFVDTKSREDHTSGMPHRTSHAGKHAQVVAPRVRVDGVAWAQLHWPQPHILRVHSLPQGSRYELHVCNSTQPEIHLLSPKALAQARAKDVSSDAKIEQVFKDMEKNKERLATQELRWKQRAESLEVQLQLLEADETEKEHHIAALRQAIAEAEEQAMEHKRQVQHWTHLLLERMASDTAAAELEKQTLHKLEHEAAEAEQATLDIQIQHEALQAELAQLEAQWVRQQTGTLHMWGPCERRPSPMQVHTLQLHRRTASLRETAHRSLSEGWRYSRPSQAARPPRSSSFHFPLAPRDDIEG